MWVKYDGNLCLTFYYTEKSSLGTNEFWVNDNVTKQSDCTWNTGNDDTKQVRQKVSTVIFDSSFAEARPKTCAWWFDSFHRLGEFKGAENFNTSEVTDMRHMFYECTAINLTDYYKYIDFSHFDTRNVKNMSCMFFYCEKIELLDLSSFDTRNVTDMSCMFYGCEKLQNIYVSDGFVVNSDTNTKDMFWNCLKLKGEVAYCDPDGKYATADGGYFIDNTKYRPWVKLDGSTLTFQYGYKHTLKENEYDLNTGKNVPGWEPQNPNVEWVIFDKSFAQVRPTTCYYWFHGCNKLDNKNIVGLNYLNTSEVKIFRDMFWNCASFKTLDLSSFNTEKCEDMAGMFNACSGLTTLNISSFKTDNVKDMIYMFYDCKTIWSLDLTNFNTSKVTAMENMFYNCSNLRSIYVSDNFTTSKVTNSKNMFYGCPNLEGNILWNANNATDKTYASTDGYFIDKSIAERPWVQFDNTSGTLSFRYTRKKTINNTTEFTLNTDKNDPAWLKYNKDVKKVNIESDFSNARPTSTYKWFCGCNQLTFDDFNNAYWYYINISEVTTMDYMFANCTKMDKIRIEDSNGNSPKLKSMSHFVSGCTSLQLLYLSKLSTENLEDMSYAFADCNSLTRLDIPNFDTKKLKNMEYLFKGCESMKSINMSKFDTQNVTNMSYMFSGCYALESLDLSNIKTENVTNMSRLFENCSSLKSLDVSSFNTANVTTAPSMFNGCSALNTIDVSSFNTAKMDNMGHMFANCSSMTTLDLTNFDTSAAKWVDNMFKNCSNLTTIYASDLFTMGSVQNSTDMFIGCEKLVGAIAYDANFVDKTYAKADGGYFIDKVYTRPWVKYNDGTLTFQYSYKKIMESDEYAMNTNKTAPDWQSQNSNVTKVVFDQSFADARPTSCYSWFNGCNQLSENNIIGLNNLNTSDVIIFRDMFKNCSKFTTINLSSFNTDKCEDMAGMFNGCNTIATLNLTTFNTNKVTAMENMFNNCSNLRTIYASEDFTTTNVESSSNMFTGCEKLFGAIAYDVNFEDKTYAKLDGGYFTDKVYTRPWVKYANKTLTFQFGYKKRFDSYEFMLNNGENKPDWWSYKTWFNKVVFDKSFVNARPTSCYSWFYDCSQLTDIEGLENLNTSECTNMAFMFNNCKNLNSLDLSNFDTRKVTDVRYMFYYCTKLKSLDLTNFDTRQVTDMYSMFNGCNSLKSVYISDEFVMALNWFAPSSTVFYCSPRKYNTTKSNDEYSELTLTPYVLINPSAEYGTLCVPIGSALAESSYSGFDKLYTIKSADKDKGTITMVEATTIEPGVAYVYHRYLPEDATESIITFDADMDASTAVTDPKHDGSLLKGTFERITAPGGCYVLQTDGNFHPVSADNTTLGVGAYRAYLDLSSLPGFDLTGGEEEAKGYRMVFEDNQTTAIDGINDQADNLQKTYFDLMGRRVSTPKVGELYIVNGKKVIYKN